MATYGLRANLSYCLIDGRPLFLDTSTDRYFRLSGEAERAFVTYAAGDTCAKADIDRLVGSGVLSSNPSSREAALRHIVDADESVLEQSATPSPYSLRAALEVASIVLAVRRKLRTRNLQVILDELDAVRRQASTLGTAKTDGSLSRQARSFLSVRKLIPVASRCLLDSISMATFLAHTHMHADIVFGVRDDPFSAHCWAQSDGLVLNDTIGNIRSYAVIRVA